MLGVVAASLEYDWKEAERRFRLAMARDPVPVNVRLQYALGYLLRAGRPVEALQQMELGLQEDPLNLILRINRAGCLVAAGRDEEAAERYREALELNPGIVGALGPLAAYHASRGELDEALVLCEKSYALAPLLPHTIGLLAGLLKRTGETRRAEELLGSLQPSDAFGCSPRPGRLPLGAPGIRRGGGLAREGHRPARCLRRHVSAVVVRKGAALHSALGRVDAEAQSAGIMITAPPLTILWI